MDVLGWLGAERPRQVSVELLVRPVVVPADDVRDSELDVVDDAGQLVRGRSVLAEERDLSEAIASEPIRGLAVDVLPFTLAHRPLVPLDAEPLEIGSDRLLAARDVARRVRVVDSQQEPVAEVAVRDGAQRVADVERPGRARCEAHSGHGASLEVEGVADVERIRRELDDARLAVLAPAAPLVEPACAGVVLEHPELAGRRAEARTRSSARPWSSSARPVPQRSGTT